MVAISLLWPVAAGGITTSFTPGEDCTAFVTRVIDRAETEILVQAYRFTSKRVAHALEAAMARGVRGIPVWIDDQVAIAHSKVMVIDGARVITGSFNFTTAAQTRNAENLLVIEDRQIAVAYGANWRRRRDIASDFVVAR